MSIKEKSLKKANRKQIERQKRDLQKLFNGLDEIEPYILSLIKEEEDEKNVK